MSYPESAASVMQTEMKFKSETIEALQRYKEANPWKGKIETRCNKMATLHNELCTIYGRYTGLRFNEVRLGAAAGSSGNSSYNPHFDTITIDTKLSVITYLHEFAHALKGSDEVYAVRWSCSLFKKFFPEKWDRLVSDRHTMVVG